MGKIWRILKFLHISTGAPFFQQKLWFLREKIHYLLISREILLLLSSKFPIMFIRWLSTTFQLKPCLEKKPISWFDFRQYAKNIVFSNILNLLIYQLNSSPTFQLTSSPTLLLSCSFTHLLTYSPTLSTLSTNGGSTLARLFPVTFCPWHFVRVTIFPCDIISCDIMSCDIMSCDIFSVWHFVWLHFVRDILS